MRPFFYRYGANCCAKQVDTTKGYPKIDLFAFKGNDRVLHIRVSTIWEILEILKSESISLKFWLKIFGKLVSDLL